MFEEQHGIWERSGCPPPSEGTAVLSSRLNLFNVFYHCLLKGRCLPALNFKQKGDAHLLLKLQEGGCPLSSLGIYCVLSMSVLQKEDGRPLTYEEDGDPSSEKRGMSNSYPKAQQY